MWGVQETYTSEVSLVRFHGSSIRTIVCCCKCNLNGLCVRGHRVAFVCDFDVCYSCGSKMCLMGFVQLARTCDAFAMAWFENRMYCRKQSLDHLPKLMMSHFGQPMAAAVVAAPIRREWELVLARPSVVFDNT